MIQVVTGKLGAGKTLWCVMHMFDALVKGRTVVTNVQLVWDELAALALRLHGVILDPRQLVTISPEKDPNWQGLIPWGTSQDDCVEVVLDEIHLFYNARDWQITHQRSKSLLSFLTQSRKAHVNVTFIAQEIKTMEAQFRALAEWEMYVTNSDHLPLGIVRYLPWKCFIVCQRDANAGYLLRRHWRSYDKRFFRCYGSFSFLDSEMNNLASSIVRVSSIKLRKVGWLRKGLLGLFDFCRASRFAPLRKFHARLLPS